MIWLKGLPVPPSANSMYLTNVHKKWKTNKKGAQYMGVGTSKRKSNELVTFQTKCLSYRNSLIQNNSRIFQIIKKYIDEGFTLRVDTFIAIEHERIWTKDNTPHQIDADNRRKALQDGLSMIIGVDDKYIFSGNIEKVTCVNKEFEQCLIRITPFRARTLDNILLMISENSRDF